MEMINKFSTKMTKNKFFLVWIIGLISIIAAPVSIAASIYYQTSSQNIGVGDTFVVDVLLDTEDQKINAIDGKISIKSESEKFAIKDFSLAGSEFKYWPQQPSLSLKDGIISFVGGIPGGINGDNIHLFKIIVLGKSSGNVSLSLNSATAYINDEKTSLISLKGDSLSIKINEQDKSNIQNEWDSIISQDKTKPYNLSVELTQDQSVFDGKKFLIMSALDDESGVDYFEVKEGDLPSVISGSTYILQNQEDDQKITVTVYDKAKNFQTTTIGSKKSFDLFLLFIVLIIICLIILLTIIVLRKRRKNRWQI